MDKNFLNTIICNDTVDAMRAFPNESVDLIFADPPYWLRVNGMLNRANGEKYDGCADDWDKFNSVEEYKNFTKLWLTECKRILKRNGSFWVIGGLQCIYSIGSIMQELGFWIINDVVWSKKNPTPNFKGTRLNNAHETLIWAVKSPSARYTFNYKTAKELNTDTVSEEDFGKGVRKQLGSVWRISVCQGGERLKNANGEKLHSTQKPEELLYRIIAISSKLGDTVLDPFGGTMTTAAIAKKMGRNYVCIESNSDYCRYGQERINKIKPEIGKIEMAEFDKKPPKVTFSEMIKANYFTVGEKLYYNYKPYYCLTAEGKMKEEGNDKIIDIHSGIAEVKHSKAKRLNGWDFWRVFRNGNLVLINDIRKQYIKEVLHYE